MEEIQKYWEVLQEKHQNYMEKDYRTDALKTRKIALILKLLLIEYRESSVEETKTKRRNWSQILMAAAGEIN